MTALPTRDCRQCGKPLVFAKTSDVFVTHFATCPSASYFTKKGGASAQDEIDDLRKQLQASRDRIAVLEARTT